VEVYRKSKGSFELPFILFIYESAQCNASKGLNNFSVNTLLGHSRIMCYR
jgi:hypothetical protein